MKLIVEGISTKLLYENSEFKVYGFSNSDFKLNQLYDKQNEFDMYIKTKDNCILPAELVLDDSNYYRKTGFIFCTNVCETEVFIEPNEVVEIWEKKE